MSKWSKDTLQFLRHVGHYSPNVVIDRSGSLYATIELGGFEAELAGTKAVLAAHMQDNALLRGIADPRLEWWDHYCCLDGQDMPPLPATGNWFADRFDRRYREAQGSGAFTKERMFVTLVWHPGDGLARVARGLLGSKDEDYPAAADRDVAQFRDLVGRVTAGMGRRYNARLLGVRRGLYSEVAEAWHVALLNRERPVGATRGALGPCIVPERVTWGHAGQRVPAGVFEIGERGRTYGSVLSYIQPPARTRATMLDELRGLRLPMTITNSARMHRRSEAVKALTAQQNHMKAAEDPSGEAGRKKLEAEAEAISNMDSAQVHHHWSVAVFAPNVETLDARVAQVIGVLSDAGITAARETEALKSAFFDRLPGNARWRVRPTPLRSSHMLAMAAKHATPQGEEEGHWGPPIIYLRTRRGTAYPFHWHCPPTPQTPAGDLGNTLFLGRSGSGKSAMMGAFTAGTLRVPKARALIVDRDFGLSTLVRACGYPYLPLLVGQPSGMVPLRRLSHCPEDLGFLRSFHAGLILSDGRGSMESEEEGWLAEGVEREMLKPPQQRSITNIGAVLGMRKKDGAAARLRKWCRGQELGWAYDGEEDRMDTSGRMFGTDTTAILSERLLTGPTLAYFFHLANKMTNGDPLLLVLDELWAADQVDAFREQNNAWLKTGRKRSIVVGAGTQSAHDVLASKIGHTFRQQVPRRVWFGESGADHDELRAMGLTSAGIKAVTETLPNIPYTALFQQPEGSYIAQFDLSGAMDMVSVISGRDTTYELANRLIAERGADPEAWVPEYERLAPGLSTRRRPVLVAAE